MDRRFFAPSPHSHAIIGTEVDVKYTALHIDVARFATDDFNPFHDKHKWAQITGNPFGGPIALGFQLTAYIAHLVDAQSDAAAQVLRYCHLRVTFADAVRVDEPVEAIIKAGQWTDHTQLSHRVALRTPRSLALTGHLRFLTQSPRDPAPPVQPLSLNRIRDRTEVPGTEYFLKRKFMTTANAKNFLIGAGIEPSLYIDELEDRVSFPAMFPVSLVSCALLERGTKRHYDFLGAPMVYAFHDIVIDRQVVARLKSNDAVNTLVSNPRVGPAEEFGGGLRRGQQVHRCLGYSGHGERIFDAEIGLVPLAALLVKSSS
jgi:acyl dehydratase